jgi:hypothetical protein
MKKNKRGRADAENIDVAGKYFQKISYKNNTKKTY